MITATDATADSDRHPPATTYRGISLYMCVAPIGVLLVVRRIVRMGWLVATRHNSTWMVEEERKTEKMKENSTSGLE